MTQHIDSCVSQTSNPLIPSQHSNNWATALKMFVNANIHMIVVLIYYYYITYYCTKSTLMKWR